MTAPKNRVRGIAELPAARVENSPGNWRTHDAAQKDKMRGLLGEVGSVSELVVWVPDDEAREALRRSPGPDGFAAWISTFTGKVRLLDGHMRKGLRGKRLGVQVTDLDAREAALVLATFDPIGAQAGRDDKLLAELLEGQRSEHRGLEDLLADLRASVGARASGAEPDLDEGSAVDPTDEILAKWAALGVAAGSLWEIPSADGQRAHRVLCGDARKPYDVERLMHGPRAKLGQHDPPYGIDVVNRSSGEGARGGVRGRSYRGGRQPKTEFTEIEGDAEPFAPMHLINAGDIVVLWGGNCYADKLPPSAEWTVWVKLADDAGESFFSSAELAWVTPPQDRRGHTRRVAHLRRPWAEPGEATRMHATQKPTAVIAKPIEWYTDTGDLVCDWYCGSGTTAIAAERLGRVAYLMEITPRYVAVTLERLTRAGLAPRRIG